jgi:O-antigen/teichoic acid export membrane protein
MPNLIARFSRGRGAPALIDQVMVSGSNFLTSIVLVRGLGLHEFGKYAIASMLLLYANASQMSFVTSPMLTIAPLMEGKEKRDFVNGMFSIQIVASLLLLVIFLLAGAISRVFTSFYSIPCILSFAFCVGTFQLQDWIRRYYYLYNKAKLAIVSDFISYFVQLALLFALWRFSALTLFGTFLVMTLTSLAGFAVGPITESFRPGIRNLQLAWARGRGLSRDLLITSQVRWFGVQGVLLIGTGIVGVEAAGGIRAAWNLAGPVNLVLAALENVIPIRISEELKKNGTAGAFAFVKRVTLLITALFGLLILPAAIFGRPLLRFLYGPAMTAFYLPMVLLLASVLVQAVAIQSFYFFRGLHDTRTLFRANVSSAIASLATVYLFGHLWKAPGIALSILSSQVVLVAYYALHWARHRDELLLLYPSGGMIKLGPDDGISETRIA